MQVIELHKLSKQLGNKMIEFKGGRVNGYTITEYNNYAPVSVTLDKSVARPDTVLSFNGAYDMLYGTPQELHC
jgi:hypothetical protein